MIFYWLAAKQDAGLCENKTHLTSVLTLLMPDRISSHTHTLSETSFPHNYVTPSHSYSQTHTLWAINKTSACLIFDTSNHVLTAKRHSCNQLAAACYLQLIARKSSCAWQALLSLWCGVERGSNGTQPPRSCFPTGLLCLQQSWAQDTRRRAIRPRSLTVLTSWQGRLVRFWQPAQRDCGKGRAGRLNVLTPTTGHDCSPLLRYYLQCTVDKTPGLLDICSTWKRKYRGQCLISSCSIAEKPLGVTFKYIYCFQDKLWMLTSHNFNFFVLFLKFKRLKINRMNGRLIAITIMDRYNKRLIEWQQEW